MGRPCRTTISFHGSQARIAKTKYPAIERRPIDPNEFNSAASGEFGVGSPYLFLLAPGFADGFVFTAILLHGRLAPHHRGFRHVSNASLEYGLTADKRFGLPQRLDITAAPRLRTFSSSGVRLREIPPMGI